jgi:hypothetical protein
MKKWLLFVFLFTANVFAFPVPKELVDGEIEVKTKAGKVYKFSANEYKVVKRTENKIIFPELHATIIQERVVYGPVIYEKINPNRFNLMLGSAPNGRLKVKHIGSTVKVSTERDFTFGLQYDRMVTDSINLGGTILSNDTFLFNLGLNF